MGGGVGGGGVWGVGKVLTQFISKSCSFSLETVFTPLILASNQNFLKIRTPLFKSLCRGLLLYYEGEGLVAVSMTKEF